MNVKLYPNYTVDYISGVMSLRKPQAQSLKIVDEIFDGVDLSKNMDLVSLRAKIHSICPTFTDFDRAFPSMTFALATGIGKTRLMGTLITYLYTNKGIKNFLIVAPSLTIYNKMINDFSNSASPKYVFQGIGCFKFPPQVMSGDDYRTQQMGNLADINIFIYNSQKFNSKDENRRFNAVNEVLGDSFLNYLKSLPDLVILMDEAHHYKNNSTADVLDEIKPVLGLEMTATPQVISGKKVIPFKNVVIDYPLAKSIRDGYTRTPYIMTRKNISSFKWGEEELDKIMIDDGLNWHKRMKKKLSDYAVNNNVPKVKPFALIVCQNIEHAEKVLSYIKSDACFNGEFKDKVIEIDSGKSTIEKDENVRLLLNVEKPDNPVEIVVHVNMLKEGWDVNNLYTIIPLRSAYSRTLVEQTIGRGLRLPYGHQTGDKEVDSVMMTAHANFQKVIDDAIKGDSIFNKENIIYVEDMDAKQETYVQTRLDFELDEYKNNHEAEKQAIQEKVSNAAKTCNVTIPPEQEQAYADICKIIYKNVEKYVSNNKANGRALDKKEAQKTIPNLILQDSDISDNVPDNQYSSEIIEKLISGNYDDVCSIVKNSTIAIPRLIKKEDPNSTFFFEDFDLDLSDFTFTPVSNQTIISNLLDPRDVQIEKAFDIDFSKVNPIRGIVAILRNNMPELDYERDKALLVKLVSQYIESLKAKYNDNEIRNLFYTNKYGITDRIEKQMLRHYKSKSLGFIEEISNVSYDIKRPQFDNEQILNAKELYSADLSIQKSIKSIVFEGGKKWLTKYYKFDSNSERMFAMACENDPSVIHWLRPAKDQFDITYKYNGIEHQYEPDFVVETSNCCYLIEVKARNEMDNPIVLAKKDRALEYCRIASNWCLANGHKPWKYLLIPHDLVSQTTSFDYFIDHCQPK